MRNRRVNVVRVGVERSGKEGRTTSAVGRKRRWSSIMIVNQEPGSERKKSKERIINRWGLSVCPEHFNYSHSNKRIFVDVGDDRLDSFVADSRQKGVNAFRLFEVNGRRFQRNSAAFFFGWWAEQGEEVQWICAVKFSSLKCFWSICLKIPHKTSTKRSSSQTIKPRPSLFSFWCFGGHCFLIPCGTPPFWNWKLHGRPGTREYRHLSRKDSFVMMLEGRVVSSTWLGSFFFPCQWWLNGCLRFLNSSTWTLTRSSLIGGVCRKNVLVYSVLKCHLFWGSLGKLKTSGWMNTRKSSAFFSMRERRSILMEERPICSVGLFSIMFVLFLLLRPMFILVDVRRQRSDKIPRRDCGFCWLTVRLFVFFLFKCSWSVLLLCVPKDVHRAGTK